MTNKKRLGADPFKGMDSLIRPNTHDTPDTHDTPSTQSAPRKPKRPRINMAFDPDNLRYITVMARLQGISATAYVNDLIEQDRERRADTYRKAQELQGEIK